MSGIFTYNKVDMNNHASPTPPPLPRSPNDITEESNSAGYEISPPPIPRYNIDQSVPPITSQAIREDKKRAISRSRINWGMLSLEREVIWHKISIFLLVTAVVFLPLGLLNVIAMGIQYYSFDVLSIFPYPAEWSESIAIALLILPLFLLSRIPHRGIISILLPLLSVAILGFGLMHLTYAGINLLTLLGVSNTLQEDYATLMTDWQQTHRVYRYIFQALFGLMTATVLLMDRWIPYKMLGFLGGIVIAFGLAVLEQPIYYLLEQAGPFTFEELIHYVCYTIGWYGTMVLPVTAYCLLWRVIMTRTKKHALDSATTPQEIAQGPY